MKLPHGERANLGTKPEEYSLNLLHKHGQHKAGVFQSVLGITSANATVLERAVKRAAAESEETQHRGHNGFGDDYELRFPLTTEKGTATVLSAWIVRREEDFPRLVTCFIL